jgi:hypothetical protein
VVAIVLGAVAAVAVILAIVFFTGKSSADDDKKKAQNETEEAQAQVSELEGTVSDQDAEITDLEEQVTALEEELGISEEAGGILSEVVVQGRTTADVLKTCSDAARDFAINFINTGVPDLGQAQAVDDQCATSDQAYADFIAVIEELEAAAE